jgi:hypothetical protein
MNVALVVKFVSYPEFLRQTEDMSVRGLQPDTIDESIARAQGASARIWHNNQAPAGHANAAAGESQRYATPLQDKTWLLNDNSPPMGAHFASVREMRVQ